MRGNLSGRGRFVRLCLGVAAIAVGAGSQAQAQDYFRIPDFAYATDAELGTINRTGFILSPDLSFSDELKLGGSGGNLLSDPDGFAIGGKAGYDYQVGGVLVGVITDAFYSWADGGGVGGLSSDLNYYGTVRGKLGVSLGRFLPYATAGYAYGGIEVSSPTGSDSQTLSGWTYGGGLEFVWNKDITLHGGYRRIDFDDVNISTSVMPAGQNTLSPEMDVFDFGFVRRF